MSNQKKKCTQKITKNQANDSHENIMDYRTLTWN